MRKNLGKTTEKLIISVFFSSFITIWHFLFFDVRVNSRMVLQPWLLQQGFIPYVQIGDEHAPLLPHMLAGLSTLLNIDSLHTARIAHGLVIWLIIAICLWIVFDKAGRWAAVACGAYFSAMSTGFGFWAMWYDLMVTPIFLAVFIVITSKRISFVRQMLVIGFLIGFGFLIKQQALILCLIIPIAFLSQQIKEKHRWHHYFKALSLSAIGFLIPVLVYLFYYFNLTNDWYALLYWPILFNVIGNYGELGAKLPSLLEIRGFLPAFIMIVPFIFTTIGMTRYKKGNADNAERWWLLLLIILSAIMLYPRYSTMHLATMLPFLALASAIACAELIPAAIDNRVHVYQQWGVYLAIVGMLWFGGSMVRYATAYRSYETRTLIEYDTLPELAEMITDSTQLEEIVLFPDDEGVGNLYYILQKSPPPFWMMNYPWFRNEYEVNRWLTEMEATQPEQVIYFVSRSPQNYPEMDNYISERYQTVHTLEWNNQVVEIKERTSIIPHEN